ncbi:MAG TPA: hypothetical protein PLV07_07450 [Acidiphilium sp.]|nr:hypothetical protein [Acidiphilium sp.]
MGKGSNTTTTTSGPPPQVLAQYQNVQNQANKVAANPYYFYPGQMVAGMSGDQTQAIGNIANTAAAMGNTANTYGMYQPYGSSAAGMTSAAANTMGGLSGNLAALANPNNTFGQAMPFTNQAGSLVSSATSPITASDINQYMNPYLQQVGQTTAAEMNQNNAIQQQQLLGNAAASGALGGDRVGLAQSALANQQNMAENAALANINNQGFQTALGAAQTTNAQQLQGASLSNEIGQAVQNEALSSLQAPFGAASTMAGTYLGAGNQMNNIGASNQAASTGALGTALSGANAQYAAGSAQQQQQQNEINAALGQWQGSVQYPFQNTGWLAGIQSGMGSLMGGQSSTTAPAPSTFSQVVGGLTGVAGLAGSIMKLKSGGRVPRAVGGFTPAVLDVAATPFNPTAAPTAMSEVGAIPTMAHGTSIPNAPPPIAAPGPAPGSDPFGALAKAVGGLGKAAKNSPWLNSGPSAAQVAGMAAPGAVPGVPLYNRGGAVAGFASGGAPDLQMPTVGYEAPGEQQLVDYQLLQGVMPGAPAQPIHYARGGEVRPGFAAGGAGAPTPQGMQDVAGMGLVHGTNPMPEINYGATNPAGSWSGHALPPTAQVAGLAMPSAPAQSFATPTTAGLAMPTARTGTSFAPLTGVGAGAAINPATGVPDNYLTSIEQASPYYNAWSSATAPSSGLMPNTPAPAAPAAPTQASINQMVQAAMAAQQQQQLQQQEAQQMGGTSGGGAKTGGRIEKAAGGALTADPQGLGYLLPPTAEAASPAPIVAAPVAAPFSVTDPASVAAAVRAAPAPLHPVAGLTATPDGPNLPFNIGPGQNAPTPAGATPAGFYGHFADRTMQAESGDNPGATNPRSTAAGPAQFTDQTWLDTVHQFAPQYAAGKTPAQILALRSNPAVSKEVTEAYAGQNAKALAAAGEPVSYTNLYLAHHFGPDGAKSILSAPANTPAGQVLPAPVLQANPDIVGKTTGQMIAKAGVAMGAQAAGAVIAQNGASDGPMPGVGASGAGTGSIASPFVVPQTVTGAVDQSQQPVSQIPTPRTTGIEKMAESPWMALADAGFNMMAGTSPFAAVNIGRGADAGVHYLQSMLPQQRARQTLQADVRQRNVANELTQREQGLRGANVMNEATRNAIAGMGEVPNYQQGQITANTVPGVSQPPAIPGIPAPSGAAQSPGAEQAVPAFNPVQVTGIPAAAKPPPSTIVGPTGQTTNYASALREAQSLLISPTTRAAAQNWLNTYGPQAYTADVKSLSDQASAAAVQKQQLAELDVAAHQFLTGPGANTRAELLKAAQTFANATRTQLPGDLANASTAAQIIPKVATFIQSGLSRMASDRGGAVVMQEVMAATPNMSSTRQGLDKLVNLYDTLATRTQAMSNYIQQAVQSGQMTYPQAQNAFNEQYPAGMWASRVDPLPVPSDTAQMQPGYVYTSGGRSAMWTGNGWSAF